MIKKDYKRRSKIKIRVLKKIKGHTDKPILTVYRSLNHIYGQIVDLNSGKTILSVSTLSKEISEELKQVKGKVEKSKIVGKFLAKKALEKNIQEVVFNRNGFKYHGRVKALAEGAREGGLNF